jgi:gluconokinase
MRSIVIMGVAGCGKSTLGAVVAQATDKPLIEGDDHHSDSNRSKMQSGVPLTDADREGWLTTLCEQLSNHPNGVVLTCSALKKAYRERLRRADTGVLFVFMEIQREQALIRVAARAHAHIFPTTLVDSQFATLESPTGEPGVLRVDAMAAMTQLQTEVTTWLAEKETA